MIPNSMLSDDIKTEAGVIGTRRQLERVDISFLYVGDPPIAPVNSVRDLNVMLDSNKKIVIFTTSK